MRIPRLFALLVIPLGGGAMLLAQETKSPDLVSNEINAQLPSWLHFSGEDRARMEYVVGAGLKPVVDHYLLNRLRLSMDVKATRWLKFIFQAEDSRVFGQNTLPAPASQKDAMDLRVGYVQFGGEEGPAALRAGRQGLDFGDGRLVADPGWSNVGRTFDAARLTLHHSLFKLDLFTAASVKVDPMGFDQPTPGEHFDGAYGSLGGLIPDARLEPYVLWKMEHGCKNESGKLGNLDEKTLGIRWVGKLPLGLDYTSEVAGQTGSWAGDSIGTWMGHWVLGFTFPDAVHRPRIYAEYNRASGNANPHDGMHGTFDPLFASTHDKYGLSDMLGSSNIVYFRSGFEYRVQAKVTVGVAYNNSWLNNSHDGLYVSGKLLATDANGVTATHIGQESDVQAQWAVTRATNTLVGFGRLFPGVFLKRNSLDISYNILYLGLNQRF